MAQKNSNKAPTHIQTDDNLKHLDKTAFQLDKKSPFTGVLKGQIPIH
ncbi:MAG: hypothetical protein R2852_09690 [Bacteroidia bacterium]